MRFYCEFWLGVGFLLGEAVFAIVPDGDDPKAGLSPRRAKVPRASGSPPRSKRIKD
ncbi:MAG: hypothetical protein V8Q54_07065 [Alistipes senegalensis]